MSESEIEKIDAFVWHAMTEILKNENEKLNEQDKEVIRRGCDRIGFPAGSRGEMFYKGFYIGVYAGLNLVT